MEEKLENTYKELLGPFTVRRINRSEAPFDGPNTYQAAQPSDQAVSLLHLPPRKVVKRPNRERTDFFIRATGSHRGSSGMRIQVAPHQILGVVALRWLVSGSGVTSYLNVLHSIGETPAAACRKSHRVAPGGSPQSLYCREEDSGRDCATLVPFQLFNGHSWHLYRLHQGPGHTFPMLIIQTLGIQLWDGVRLV
jgi:hypothetical protein